MRESTRLADYLLYLAYLTKKLGGFFEKQSPYIFCKKGCSKCCENGEYPFSRLEYDFIMIGFSKLAPEVREEILKKVKRIKAAKQQSSQAAKLDNSKILQEQQPEKSSFPSGEGVRRTEGDLSEEQRAGGQEGKPLIVESGKLKVESLSSHAPSPDGEGWDGVILTDNDEIIQKQQPDKNPSTVQPFNPSTNDSPSPQPFSTTRTEFSLRKASHKTILNRFVRQSPSRGEGACDGPPPTDKNFTYECPFLINNECSVYEFRGIICRSFGLMSINPEGLSKIPFCAFEGLNYSNVVEPDTKIISTEKYKKLGENIPEPLAYNVGYKFLTSKDIEENFKIDFGDKKALIDWF